MPQLPDEILLCIVECLSLTDLLGPDDFEEYEVSRTTLANLSLSSKDLYKFAQPLLFRAFVKDADDCSEHSLGITAQFRPLTRLESFLRTLIQRPDLAAKVEGLRLKDFQDELVGRDKNGDLLLVDFTVTDMLLAASHDIPPQDPDNPRNLDAGPFGSKDWQEDWRFDLSGHSDNAEVALLLTLVPNLRYLDMTTGDEDFGLHVMMLLQQMLGSCRLKLAAPNGSEVAYEFWDLLTQSSNPLSILSRLETLIIRSEEHQQHEVALIHCIPLMTIPTVRYFAFHGGIDGIDGSGPAQYRIPLGHLRHLRLDDCIIDHGVVVSLIERSKQLQSLEINFSIYNEKIDLGDEFLSSLAKISDTLQRLQLSVPDMDDDLISTQPFDLRQFTSLKSLEITQWPFFPVPEGKVPWRTWGDLLPKSLELLDVRETDHTFTDHLDFFHDNKVYEQFPNLKQIKLELRRFPFTKGESFVNDQEEIAWDDALRKLSNVCKSAGIDCKI